MDTELPTCGESVDSIDCNDGNDDDCDPCATSEEVLRDQQSFLSDVTRFYDQPELSDVSLQVGARTYLAHRFVLAKSSDVFRAMLYDPAWSRDMQICEQTTSVVRLKEAEECELVFDSFLRYLYTAEVRIDTATAVGILCLADKYQVESLRRLCTDYMISQSASPRLRHALTWYPWGKMLGLSDLRQQCARTISWGYQTLIDSSDWPITADMEFLADTLGSSELVVSEEYALWVAVSRWLLHESRRSALARNACRLLPLLRFSQMNVRELHSLEQSDLAVAIAMNGTLEIDAQTCETTENANDSAACREMFQSLLSRAYRFHALCSAANSLGLRFADDTWYTPRDYTHLTADCVRTHATLRLGMQVDVKVPRSPAPGGGREADWKVTYRKCHDDWTIQLYPHETALTSGETHVQTTVLLYDQRERVIQVQRNDTCACARGTPVVINVLVLQPAVVYSMALLIKPMPS